MESFDNETVTNVQVAEVAIVEQTNAFVNTETPLRTPVPDKSVCSVAAMPPIEEKSLKTPETPLKIEVENITVEATGSVSIEVKPTVDEIPYTPKAIKSLRSFEPRSSPRRKNVLDKPAKVEQEVLPVETILKTPLTNKKLRAVEQKSSSKRMNETPKFEKVKSEKSPSSNDNDAPMVVEPIHSEHLIEKESILKTPLIKKTLREPRSSARRKNLKLTETPTPSMNEQIVMNTSLVTKVSPTVIEIKNETVPDGKHDQTVSFEQIDVENAFKSPSVNKSIRITEPKSSAKRKNLKAVDTPKSVKKEQTASKMDSSPTAKESKTIAIEKTSIVSNEKRDKTSVRESPKVEQVKSPKAYIEKDILTPSPSMFLIETKPRSSARRKLIDSPKSAQKMEVAMNTSSTAPSLPAPEIKTSPDSHKSFSESSQFEREGFQIIDVQKILHTPLQNKTLPNVEPKSSGRRNRLSLGNIGTSSTSKMNKRNYIDVESMIIDKTKRLSLEKYVSKSLVKSPQFEETSKQMNSKTPLTINRMINTFDTKSSARKKNIEQKSASTSKSLEFGKLEITSATPIEEREVQTTQPIEPKSATVENEQLPETPLVNKLLNIEPKSVKNTSAARSSNRKKVETPMALAESTPANINIQNSVGVNTATPSSVRSLRNRNIVLDGAYTTPRRTRRPTTETPIDVVKEVQSIEPTGIS